MSFKQIIGIFHIFPYDSLKSIEWIYVLPAINIFSFLIYVIIT